VDKEGAFVYFLRGGFIVLCRVGLFGPLFDGGLFDVLAWGWMGGFGERERWVGLLNVKLVGVEY